MVVVSTGSHGKPFLLGDTPCSVWMLFSFSFIYLKTVFWDEEQRTILWNLFSNQNRLWNVENEKTKKLFGCRKNFFKNHKFYFPSFFSRTKQRFNWYWLIIETSQTTHQRFSYKNYNFDHQSVQSLPKTPN